MKDQRYQTIHGLLKEGKEIEKFTDIFNWVPYSVVAADLDTNNPRMKKMKADPSLWTLGELWQLADLIGYSRKKLVEMAGKQGEDMRKGIDEDQEL